MKRNILFLLCLFISITLIAQAPKLSATQAGKPPLVTPKIPPVKPADLSVTGIQLVTAEKIAGDKSVALHIKITIKNNGQVDAAATKIAGAFQKDAQSPSWAEVSELVDFPVIKGGQSVTKDCIFKILISSIDAGHAVHSFNFRVKADVMNTVKESDENNNFSQGILIGL
jgi:CARDB